MSLEQLLTDQSTHQNQLRALVVDDDRLFRRVVCEVLKRKGYQVFEGSNGNEAVELCLAERPDLLVIDVSMPERDGISAVSEIKTKLSNHYMPVIFITASEDENILARCILVGGDEFISKPFNPTLLRTKLIAIERNRAMYMALNEMHSSLQRNQEIAEQVFSKAVVSPNINYEGLNTFIRSASTFSGDVLLTAARPNGDLSVLIGDFTGHGLSAAIGALPVSDTFRAMTAKGYSGPEIIHQISKKLCSMLPTGIFFSSALATISHEYKTVSVWNGGMPDIWLMGTSPIRIKKTFPSRYPPLGIVHNNIEDITFEVFDLLSEDTLIMCSDGLLEARNEHNEQFGEERYLDVIKAGLPRKNIANLLTETLDEFLGTNIIEDDVTFAEIPFNPKAPVPILTPAPAIKDLAQDHRWDWHIRLENQMLRKTDLVPLVMNQLQDLMLDSSNVQQVYTVFTELYLNALEHGVLSLPSSMKSDAEGFAKYFAEKEHRLRTIETGWIDVRLRYESGTHHGQLIIQIKDSGPGFDIDKWMKTISEDNTTLLSGRGLKLILELTEELNYYPPGNHVQAVMEWSTTAPG